MTKLHYKKYQNMLHVAFALLISKSTGIDGVSARVLKYTTLSVPPSLFFFNLSNTAGCHDNWPWKIARIVPIPKAVDMSSPTNVRPISILPIISKVLEHHI